MSPDKEKFKYPSLEESRKILAGAKPSDFDGHTSFQDMTTEERIQWASITAMSVFLQKEKMVREANEDD